MTAPTRVMLSAETASGDYPVEAVAIMDRIIAKRRARPAVPQHLDAYHAEPEAHGAGRDQRPPARSPHHAPAAIVTYTTTGSTALRAARERPDQPILGLITQFGTARRLALVWGLHGVVCEDAQNIDHMVERACHYALESGIAGVGSSLVITAGVPFGTPGSTNLLRIAWVR